MAVLSSHCPTFGGVVATRPPRRIAEIYRANIRIRVRAFAIIGSRCCSASAKPALTECPACGKSALRKLVSAAGFRLSGGGWYETDFKTGGQRNIAGDAKSDAKSAETKSADAKSSGKDGGRRRQAQQNLRRERGAEGSGGQAVLVCGQRFRLSGAVRLSLSCPCAPIIAARLTRRSSAGKWSSAAGSTVAATTSGVIFIDLRDRGGLLQIVADPARAEVFALAESVRNEFVLKATGKVRPAPPDTANPELPTGQVEVACERLEILNEAATPPFQIDEDDVGEEVRLRFR